jgi:hypothetical protein
MKPRHMLWIPFALLIAYPISFGPVVWISSRRESKGDAFDDAFDQFGIEFYEPLVRLAERNPQTCNALILYQLVFRK